MLGDFVKGRVSESLPPELRAGIRLHRRIDAFSNRLADTKPSIARLGAELRRGRAPCCSTSWRIIALH